MRLIRPLAMTNANIPREKKEKTIHKKEKILKKYKYKLWYKNQKFLSFVNSFLKFKRVTFEQTIVVQCSIISNQIGIAKVKMCSNLQMWKFPFSDMHMLNIFLQLTLLLNILYSYQTDVCFLHEFMLICRLGLSDSAF